MDQKETKYPITMTGNDLRKMRIKSGKTTSDMAAAVGVKSRKTIENWERDFCEPTIGQFIVFCLNVGFNPGLVVAAAIERNASDPSRDSDIDLTECLLT